MRLSFYMNALGSKCLDLFFVIYLTLRDKINEDDLNKILIKLAKYVYPELCYKYDKTKERENKNM